MSRIGVLIHFVAKPGQRDALAAHLLQAASGYAAEQGTELFTISLSPRHDDEVVVFETYRDEAAKRAHESAPGYAAIRAATGEFLGGPPRVQPLLPLGGKGL
jgi:quinol monooxygenase YgiN